MSIPKTQSELTELFRALGAPSPEGWARSQVQEGIPQLLRFLFLKQAWERIIGEDDIAWVQEAISRSAKHPTGPYAGLGAALQRIVQKGVAIQDITDVARCLQAQTLFDVAYLVDGPAYAPVASLEDISWGLFEIDEEGRPVGEQISGLHESVLGTDPTGREMRPRDPS